uniref:Nuclear pore membrane glycoprotein 210-like n=1 Tax=Saccoglossus kowalevskii TaxID=10224 RepID=A0ABM0MQL9_SACKO|nr:PREDICTED: nuclear pore membrane glycoprotein 210-like [Saccoglossus kowalevskii]
MLKLTHLKGYGPTKNYHLFHAVCLDFGEKMLKVIVGNNPTSKNHFPATTNTTIRISCAKPTSLHLIPVIKQPVLEKPCPITPDSHSQIPVHHSQNLEIIVVVADNNGHNFDNFSSLIVTWETSDKSLAGFVDPVTLVTDEDGDYPGSKSLRAVQNAVLTAKLGLVSVTATIVGYDTKLLRARSINLAPKIIPTISKSLELILVKDALITPSTISIFNHPSSMVSLIVSGGSGYFYIESSQQNIAQIKYLEKKKEIQVTPQFDGSVVITANDLCLYSPTHAVSHVYISGVNLIEVRVVDKVEINKDITASVRVLDSKNKPLQQRYFELMGLKPHPSSNIITVRHDTEHSYDEFTAYYIIHGMSLGRTSLSFVASLKNGQTVSSRPKDIQVFPSLRLNPRNVTLIIGAVFQVHSFGGPQPQSHIEYSIDDKNIANINGSGLIEALSLGHTRINGKAQGFDTETGETVVYSQDQIDVYVVRLTAINVYAPLSRLETAAEMPVYAIGVNEHQTPFTFGHAIPGLKFYWTVSNVDVITLSTVYHKIGIDSSDENNFGMRLHAINPGQATVRLKVTISQSGHNQILDDMVLIDEVQIEVFAKLSLIHPDTCSSMLLMSHNTQTQIKTNRDGSARVSYSLLNLFDGEPVITIDSMGYVNSRSLTGQTSVLITSHEEFGINQTAVVLVKVKPVSYLAINCEMAVTTMERKLYSFPVGISLFFTISFHDDLGEKFHSTNSELNFRINRFDLLQVNQGLENGTFVARATSSGNTIFKVWDKNSPHIADYVNVPVDSVITPKDSSHITVGDIVCFNSPLVKLDGQRGHWNSMDGSILFVDFHSGVGIATRPGTTTVYQNLTDNFVTHTEITVHAVQDISIDDTAVMYVSNLPKDEPYKIPVVLGEMSNNVKGDNCSQEILQSMYNRLTLHSVPFQCIIKFDNNADIRAQDLFGVTTAFDVKNGQYYCSISQMQMLHSLQLLSTIDSTLQLSVSVLRQDNQPLIKSRIVSLPFLPAFYISQSDITISNKHPQTELVVHGIKKVLDTVQVLCNDSSVVEVKTGVDVGASKRYPITLLDTVSPLRQGSVSVHIEVTSTLTGQSQLLPVKIPLMGTDEKHEPVKLAGWARVVQIIANNYQSWLYHIMIVLATIGALFIGYHFLVAPRYYHSAALNRSGVFLQPGQGSPPPYMATPPHSHGSPIRSPYYGDIPSMSPSRRKSPKLWSTGVHHPDRSDSFH